MSLKENLEAKVKKIEADFQATTERAKVLVEKRADIQRQLSDVDRELAGVRDEQLGLRGAHTELSSLVGVEKPETEPETPKTGDATIH